MDKATKTVERFSWFLGSSQINKQHQLSTNSAALVDPRRLTTSLAESILIRAGIKPITFVFKLWASYMIVKHGKKIYNETWKGQSRSR